jgi:phosphatidylserine decarboxylase
MNIFMEAIKLLPRNLISYVAGFIVSFEFPAPIATALNKIFVYSFKIKMEEAEKPLEDYPSIQKLFTRKLKPGSRSINSEVCSPADGWLQFSNKINSQQELIQAKGFNYPATELIALDEKEAPQLEWFTSIYLSPQDYHRVHSPVSGKLVSITHVRGDLWPVNNYYVENLSRLFCRNERLIFTIDSNTNGKVFVVMIGALNVGKIASSHLPDFYSNEYFSKNKYSKKVFRLSNIKEIKSGEELGTFMMGSSTVVLFEKNSDFIAKNAQKIKLGQSLIK